MGLLRFLRTLLVIRREPRRWPPQTLLCRAATSSTVEQRYLHVEVIYPYLMLSVKWCRDRNNQWSVPSTIMKEIPQNFHRLAAGFIPPKWAQERDMFFTRRHLLYITFGEFDPPENVLHLCGLAGGYFLTTRWACWSKPVGLAPSCSLLLFRISTR